jgi:hypothetical protein
MSSVLSGLFTRIGPKLAGLLREEAGELVAGSEGGGAPVLCVPERPQSGAAAPTLPFAEGGGRIAIIGLDDVKAALADRWPVQAERAKGIARTVIQKRLDVADVFAETDGDRFVICFASLSSQAARLKSELIAREIRQRLLGDRDDVLVVSSYVIGAGAQTSDNTPRAAHDQPLVRTLGSLLDAARAEGRRAAAQAASDLLNRASLELSPVLSRTLAPTGLAVARLGGDCLPWISTIDGGDEYGARMFELDALLLALVLKHIYRSFQPGESDTIIVPINWTTMRERRFSEEYITLCRDIDQSARARIVFEVHGLPPDIASLRLEERLACLVPFSAHRALRAVNVHHRFANLARFRLTMMSLVAARSHVWDAKAPRAFETFVGMVRNSGTGITLPNSGCRVWVRDVKDLESAGWYTSKGADFVNVTGAGCLASGVG